MGDMSTQHTPGLEKLPAEPAPGVGPVPARQRAVAPDVARGLALLGIALANSAIHLWGGDVGPWLRPVDGSALDRLVNGVVALLVDRRTMPMFALLYGYGIGVAVRRRAAAAVPWPAARDDLLRRGGVLAMFGVVHIILLFGGDILATYGLTGLLAVTFVRARGRWFVVVGVLSALIWSVVSGVSRAATVLMEGAATATVAAMSGDESVLGSLGGRVTGLLNAPLGVTAALPMVLLGLWLARQQVLENPSAHLPRLRRWALGGLAVSVLGGLPAALAVARVWEPGAGGVFLATTLHEATGFAGGLAFAALVGWVVAARRLTVDGLGPVGSALRAVGSRSLTCYLLQSVLFVLPLNAWAGGLGEDMGSAQVVAWAVGVWLVTVLVAVVLERAGRRGPAEAVYRWLVYRPQG